ncbi:MAG: molybdenum cofactor guanylyltransferase [Firmicutes bacterium]|nr:molybdenum cofactor guanylyltransferase [Bacillota bacterium]
MMQGRVTDAALLAGGRGSRFPSGGRHAAGGKLQADLCGTPLLSMSADALARIFESPFLVAPGGFELAGQCVLRRIPDEQVGAGPGAGIAAAVKRSADWCFVAAADMPFLDAALIADFIGTVEGLPDDALCAVPVWERGLEPLHAFYRRGAYGRILDFLRDGRRSLIELAEELRASKLDAEAAARRSGSDLEAAFFNVNTAEDLEEARRMKSIGIKPKGAMI